MADEHDDVLSKLEEFVDLFESQLMEIEAIQSIYSGEKELGINNIETIEQMTAISEKYRANYERGKADRGVCNALLKRITYLRCISLDVRLQFNEITPEVVNVNITLPIKYPKEAPKVFISSNGLTREEQGFWNAEMDGYLEKNFDGDQVIYQTLEWLKETGENHMKNCNDLAQEENGDRQEKKLVVIGSMWLYMHHIYNKEKRKDIINWANELQLTGFSLPGKPGVVHVEGDMENIDEYFIRLRRLSWKRMSCVHKDSFSDSSNWKRTFNNFEELCFDAHGGRDYHMNMGKFHIFLKEHNLGQMFTILFGIKE